MGGRRDWRKEGRKERGKGREGERKRGEGGTCSKVLGDRRPWVRLFYFNLAKAEYC